MQKFNEIADKNPFKVPENYFEDVNRKIISGSSEHNREIIKVKLHGRLRPYYLIAASFIGFILLSYSVMKLVTHERINSQLSEIIFTEYTDSYINDIDILALEENVASFAPGEEEPDVTKTDIIDYLLLENIEINDIFDQL
jgi:hypothetical protein